MRDVELAIEEHGAQFLRHRLRLGEAGFLGTGGVELRHDLAGIGAVDDRATLAPDEVEQHLLAVQFQLARLGEGSLDDVGVERAGQTPVGVGDDQQVHLILAGSCEQRRRAFARTACDLGGEAGDHRFQPAAIGARGFGGGLRLAQLRGGDHLLRLGDLLGRFDRPDPNFQFLEAGHILPTSTLFRHSRAGGNLSLDRAPRTTLGRWIPAFAGMTVFIADQAKVLPKLSSAAFSLPLASSPRSLLSRIAASTSG